MLHSSAMIFLTLSVVCTLCTSATSSLGRLASSLYGRFHMLLQNAMTFSSLHAFSWKRTTTLLSYCLFSVSVIRRPFPRKASRGFTRVTASAKIVNCAVHWRLSRPDAPPLYQTVLAPFFSTLFHRSKRMAVESGPCLRCFEVHTALMVSYYQLTLEVQLNVLLDKNL